LHEERGRHAAEHPTSIDIGRLDSESHESGDTLPQHRALIRDALREQAEIETGTEAGSDNPLAISALKR
jgi:hypothetical protein